MMRNKSKSSPPLNSLFLRVSFLVSLSLSLWVLGFLSGWVWGHFICVRERELWSPRKPLINYIILGHMILMMIPDYGKWGMYEDGHHAVWLCMSMSRRCDGILQLGPWIPPSFAVQRRHVNFTSRNQSQTCEKWNTCFHIDAGYKYYATNMGNYSVESCNNCLCIDQSCSFCSWNIHSCVMMSL